MDLRAKDFPYLDYMQFACLENLKKAEFKSCSIPPIITL
jgi:hypothetical protein